MDRALYPISMVQWYVYALFIQDEEHIKQDCKYIIVEVEQKSKITNQVSYRNACHSHLPTVTNYLFSEIDTKDKTPVCLFLLKLIRYSQMKLSLGSTTYFLGFDFIHKRDEYRY